MYCQRKTAAPCRMVRGSATTDGKIAYFTPLHSKAVYKFDLSAGIWQKLPPCPYFDSGLAILDGKLIAVGGHEEHRSTKMLYTFISQKKKWITKYPEMRDGWSSPAVVTTSDGSYLIVIGWRLGDRTAKVELLQVKFQQWHVLTAIQSKNVITKPSATIYSDKVYVIETGCKGYSCSLEALPPGDEPFTSQSVRKLVSWTPLPRLPVTDSTAATLCGNLIIIGGRQKRPPTPMKYIYQLVNGLEWEIIGCIGSERALCLAVNPSPEKVLIVSGQARANIKSHEEYYVEECNCQ